MILSDIEKRIKEKIERVGTPLKDWDIQINYGIKTEFNEAFIIDGVTKDALIKKSPKNGDIIRPILRGRDIKRYDYQFADLWLIGTFLSLKIDIEEYPAIKDYLLSFGYDRLKQTGDPNARKKTNNKWFETQDSISYWDDFSKHKIAWGNLALNCQFTIIDEGYYINAPSAFFATNDLYLLAILNSSVSNYYIKSLGVTRNGGYFEFKPMFVEQMPIPQLNDLEKSAFINLVKQLYQDKTNLKIRYVFENKINRLVYKLFYLSEEEIEFIENCNIKD